METAKTFTYNDLVSYQEGSVVSKAIIDKPAGTVTVFAFDKNEGLSTHSAPYDALVEVIDGRAGITIEGTEYELGAGQALVMPANKPHALSATERFKMVLTMIRQKDTR